MAQRRPSRVPHGSPPELRFAAWLNITDACWLWEGSRNTKGYGQFTIGRRGGKVHSTQAHRYAYASFVGQIPEEYDVDHLCGVRLCCNPDHLEAVTHAENAARKSDASRMASGQHQRAKTHCPSGHAYDEANTVIYDDGRRHCIACRNIRNAARYAA